MTQHRLFVAKDLNGDDEIWLGLKQSHYLLHVLRLKQGDTILAFDGRNGEWLAAIAQLKKGCCSITPLERVRAQVDGPSLHYAFALLKQARLDYTIQKAVEMGASSLQPLITANTIASRFNLERARDNAIEAAEQCGILSIPDIAAPIKLQSLLEACRTNRVIVFCDERAPISSPVEALGTLRGRGVTVLIGPEGGFSKGEHDLLTSKDFVKPISLGPRVMRADTAAVAALALVNAVLGDWREP